MTDQQLKTEIERRLANRDDETNVKCNHCAAGYRHRIGNCILCGHGPSPAHIEWMGLTELPVARINALCAS